MNKAFIFDMDGVIINSEQVGEKCSKDFYIKLFGEEVSKKLDDTMGLTLDSLYDKASSYGFSMEKKKFIEAFDREIAFVYSRSVITEGINELVQALSKLNFHLGLVSSSRQNWIDLVLPRLQFRSQIECIISINDTLNLRSKPYPDGYLEAVKKLHASPETTIVLEDSNSGIQAAKKSGVYTIGFRQNIIPGYQQKGADIYANTMFDVINIVTTLPWHAK